LTFIRRALEKPDALDEACRELDGRAVSTGFQTGMLTPVLNALAPDDFLLVNNKSRRLINYLAGKKLSQKLVDYPEINRTGWILIEHLADLLESAPAGVVDGARTEDVFDAFSHWLVSIRSFPFGGAQYWKLAPGENARSGTTGTPAASPRSVGTTSETCPASPTESSSADGIGSSPRTRD
jgi:hypothetical protein